jgi:hypothetical protein
MPVNTSGQAPASKTIDVRLPVMATAGTDLTSFVMRAPFDGGVTAVRFTADAAITGVNTNNRTFNLVNKGQAGAGTTVIASLAMNTGVNAVAGDELPITLSAVAGATDVVAGDILAWFSDAGGTGIADPGGLLSVDFGKA